LDMRREIRCPLSVCQKCGGPVAGGQTLCASCRLIDLCQTPSVPKRSSGVFQPIAGLGGTRSTREKGNSLEDAVANYFRQKEYSVETRLKMHDRDGVSHEIDVLGSKSEAFGTIRVAAECKYVSSPIGIEDIRNFQVKLTALNISKGIFLSTAGFTADAKAQARSLGIDTLDLAAIQRLIAPAGTGSGELVSDALPIDVFTVRANESHGLKHLINPQALSSCNESDQLTYHPYYFMEYHAFSQFAIAGNQVNLESRGSIVIDGISGRIIDARCFGGICPTLPDSGRYVKCGDLLLRTITGEDLRRWKEDFNVPQENVSVLEQQIDAAQAKNNAKIEIVKAVSLQYKYRTTRTSGEKTLHPKAKDVEVSNVRQVKIPTLSRTYRVASRVYSIAYNAATGETINNGTKACRLCNNQATQACENCGSLACQKHARICVTCRKRLCDTCASSRGLITKTYYCNKHTP